VGLGSKLPRFLNCERGPITIYRLARDLLTTKQPKIELRRRQCRRCSRPATVTAERTLATLTKIALNHPVASAAALR